MPLYFLEVHIVVNETGNILHTGMSNTIVLQSKSSIS
jgi:hypothetical protein